MSSGKSKNLKPAKVAGAKKSKAGRPTTEWQAWDRWGLGKGVGARQAVGGVLVEPAAARVPPAAYTAEDYVADASRGYVAPIVHIVPNACPRTEPVDECPGGDSTDFGSIVTARRQIRAQRRPSAPSIDRMDASRRLTRCDGSAAVLAPVVSLTPGTVRYVRRTCRVCTECGFYVFWRDRQRFYVEYGDHGLGYARPSFATRRKHLELAKADERDERADHTIATALVTLEAAAELFARESGELASLVGPVGPVFSIEGCEQRYEQGVLLAWVRRFVTAHLRVRIAPQAGEGRCVTSYIRPRN